MHGVATTPAVSRSAIAPPAGAESFGAFFGHIVRLDTASRTWLSMGAPGLLWRGTGSRIGDGGLGCDSATESDNSPWSNKRLDSTRLDSTSELSCVPNSHGIPEFPEERGGSQ